jgi:HEAT repeat protein
MEKTSVSFRELARTKLTPMIERVRSQRWPAPVQRFGRKAEQVFARIVDRWPALDVLRTQPSPKPARRSRAEDLPIPNESVIETASGNVATILRLLADLETSEAWQVRVSAATGLGNFHGDEVLDGLVSAVRDPSAEVAIAAISSLARQPGTRAAADLEEVFRDSAGYVSPYTRAAAVCAIARIRGADALHLLLDAVHDIDAEVSIAAIDLVADTGAAEGLPKLRTLLEDRSGYFLPAVRLATANALLRAGMLSPDLALSLLPTEPDDDVREVLITASVS